MTQTELISRFGASHSLVDRALLLCPDYFGQLQGIELQECRVFLLVTSGSLKVRTGGRETEVGAPSLVDMLVWEPVELNDFSADLKAWCLMPNYMFTNESLNGLRPADSEAFKDRYSVPVMQLERDEAGVLQNQLRLLLGAMGNVAHAYRPELCQTYFRSFMLEAGNIRLNHSRDAEEADGVESRQDVIVRGFLKLVWKYYKTEHNIDFYSERLCLSSKHLSRVVRAKLGKTPYAVIRDELLQRAELLLKDTKMSVKEVAEELHFSEMAAFCKFFKKKHGVSPTAYRTKQHI